MSGEILRRLCLLAFLPSFARISARQSQITSDSPYPYPIPLLGPSLGRAKVWVRILVLTTKLRVWVVENVQAQK